MSAICFAVRVFYSAIVLAVGIPTYIMVGVFFVVLLGEEFGRDVGLLGGLVIGAIITICCTAPFILVGEIFLSLLQKDQTRPFRKRRKWDSCS